VESRSDQEAAAAAAADELARTMASNATTVGSLQAELAGKDAAIAQLVAERRVLETRVEAERTTSDRRERATRLEMEAALCDKEQDKENAMAHQVRCTGARGGELQPRSAPRRTQGWFLE
jgi:peptidoglycan hydrolase CwlO-like protein